MPMLNVFDSPAGEASRPGIPDPCSRSREETRFRHVVAEPADSEDGWAAHLRAAAEQRVDRELALARESGLLVLRQHSPPHREACTVPTQFVPCPMAGSTDRAEGPPLPILSEIVQSCADRTLVLLHGGLVDRLLLELTECLRLRAVPYVVVTHGIYLRDLASSCPAGSRGAPRSVQRTLLEAARSVEVVSPHERDVVREIAPHAACVRTGTGAGSMLRAARPIYS